jgi:molybdopterin-guanine dinucleotide biosynthesis protein A
MLSSPERKIVGVVLAGGASRRMQTDKALVEIGERPMLEWVVDALKSVADEVIVSGPARNGDGDLTVRFIPDLGPSHGGPLSGLVSVMDSAERDALLLTVGVDQPWVRPETLRALTAKFDGLPVVPVPDGIRQTTCGVYPTDLLLAATRELNAGGSVQSLLDRTAFTPFTEADALAAGEDGRSWFSVNSPADIARGIGQFGIPTRR